MRSCTGHGGPYARLRARLEALEVKKKIKKNVNDPTKISMMILNMVSLLQNGGDYKDFYKSGKKEDFASYDEY